MKFYSLAESPTRAELETLGWEGPYFSHRIDKDTRHTIMAVSTRQKRTPHKGEWYLSGAAVQAWRARHDLSIELYIARLVRVETKQHETVRIIVSKRILELNKLEDRIGQKINLCPDTQAEKSKNLP